MSNALNKQKKPEKVVDIKAEYERIQKAEEDDRLATEKQINELLTAKGYQYLVLVNFMGALVPLGNLINPEIVASIRLVPKPKE